MRRLVPWETPRDPAGHDGLDARQRHRLVEVDRFDAGMRMGAAQNLAPRACRVARSRHRRRRGPSPCPRRRAAGCACRSTCCSSRWSRLPSSLLFPFRSGRPAAATCSRRRSAQILQDRSPPADGIARPCLYPTRKQPADNCQTRHLGMSARLSGHSGGPGQPAQCRRAAHASCRS